jgi:hypothetical protein
VVIKETARSSNQPSLASTSGNVDNARVNEGASINRVVRLKNATYPTHSPSVTRTYEHGRAYTGATPGVECATFSA